MKIVIECFGEDNDALKYLSDNQLAAWLLLMAHSKLLDDDDPIWPLRIRDLNGNTVATVKLT